MLASNKEENMGWKQELFLAIREQNWIIGKRQWVAVSEEGGSEEGTALGPGQEGWWAAPRVLDKKLEKGSYDRKNRVEGREEEGIASSWGVG